jgi:hypothetical protein
MSIAEAVWLVIAVARALGAAHEHGIIHRDVKPSNILLEGGDLARPRIVDFGIARRQDGDRILTLTGTILGTPGYMAPEQARGVAAVSSRTDVYALGCLLFRCLAGQTPFAGIEPVALLARAIIEDAPRLRERRRDVSLELDELVARMLARNPAERPRDGADVANELERMFDGETEITPQSIAGHEAITSGQQRFVTAILSAANAAVGRGDLDLIAEQHHARAERLADGSLLLVFMTAAAPKDLALQAWNAAWELADIDPSFRAAIVSGRTIVRGSLPIGGLLERAAAALRDEEPGVILDGATKTLIAPLRTLLGKPTPCVGRDRELRFLEGLFAESVEENAARVALVVAAAGTGKTRLTEELHDRLREHGRSPLVLFATGAPLGGTTPFALFGQALRRAAGCIDLAPEAPDETTSLAEWIGRRLSPTDVPLTVPYLVSAAQLDSAEEWKAPQGESGDVVMRRAFLRWLAAELDEHPVVILLDDLQWGDRPTIELVDAALRTFADRALTVVGLGRPEVLDVFPGLWEKRDRQELRLGPLTKSASLAIVKSAGLCVDESTVTTLVERAGGNAFFLEELVRSIADGRDAALPDTVLAVLHARFDALGAELTRALRAASVFGRAFWQEGVAMLLGVEPSSRRLGMWMTALVERELVDRKNDTSIADAHEFSFRHDLVREAAYAMLTEDDQRLAHRLAGEWLEQAGARDASVLATHFDRAREAERAVHWATIDAERAVLAFDSSAYDRAERGIALGAMGEDLGRLLLAQARTKYRAHNHALASTTLARRAMTYLEPASPPWYRAILVALRSMTAHSTEEFATGCMELIETKPRTDRSASEVEYVACLGELILHASRSDQPTIIPALVSALGPYLPRVNEMPVRASSCLESVLSMRAALEQRPEEALRAAERAADKARQAGEHGLDLGLAAAQRYAFLGQMAEGFARIERIIVESERLGVGLTLGVGPFGIAFGKLFFGDTEGAWTAGQALLQRKDVERTPSMLRRLSRLLATAAYRMGLFDEGDEHLSRLLAGLSEASPLWRRAHLVRAEGLLARARSREALELIEMMRPLVPRTPFDQDEAEHVLLHAHALRACGDDAGATALVRACAEELRSIALSIGDPTLRASFLDAIPAHRDVCALAE